jgi:hypothetical protein
MGCRGGAEPSAGTTDARACCGRRQWLLCVEAISPSLHGLVIDDKPDIYVGYSLPGQPDALVLDADLGV